MEFTIIELRSILISSRNRLSNESDLQDDLNARLQCSKYKNFKKEWSFNKESRIDFFDPDLGIGIEVKIKGSPNEILKQLERYAKIPEVKVLVLATAFFMGLPPEIEGKPVYLFHLSKGLL
ncbi:hypothetical protein MASR1M48_16920 [Lactococcus petauri]